MKKIVTVFFVGAFLALAASCGFLDGNKPGDKQPFNPEAYFREGMLANIEVQIGHIQRISALWSGQLGGYTGSYRLLYDYNITSEETNSIWLQAYPGSITLLREVRNNMQDDLLHRGIAKVMEAYVVGTLTSVFGDIPYSEILRPNVSNPKFDSQLVIYDAIQDLLDEGIADLETASPQVLDYDIYFKGNIQKWIETAHTLKARFFLHAKDYSNAFSSAQNGISSPDNSLKFYPALISGTARQNTFFEALSGAYAAQVGTRDTYLMDLLDSNASNSRNHAKTKEAARRAFLSIDEIYPSNNLGYSASDEPQGMVTYEENLLILAETAGRVQDITSGLAYLNQLRDFLDSGAAFRKVNQSDPIVYDAFTTDDFLSGGIENKDGINPLRAFLREVIEERYVSCFGSYAAFDDARRLRKSDEDVRVPFPFNKPGATAFPERFPIAQAEQSNNVNAPADPGIYAKTAVNQ
ncbi:MAG: SusD/RagB family nutrient-binding outer membrane lipoprotein [Bacteroidia bacterium]